MLEVAIKKQLPDFSLDVEFAVPNGLLAIFGPSGAGKTLTLQAIAGLLAPDAGRIVVGSRPVFDSSKGINLRPQERRVGYVFQNYALMPHLSVWDNVAYGLHRLPAAEREARVERLVDTVRLRGLERRLPGALSGGQQQRVALARALATEPAVLLLDEPFSALDSAIRSRLHGELLTLLHEVAVTTVLVTHNLSEAYTLSENMAVIEAGRVLQLGPREELLRRPATRAVARFVGTKNLFRGVVRAAEPDYLEVAVEGLLVRTPPGAHAPGSQVDLCIRPEEVMVIRPGREIGVAVEENRYWGVVVDEIAQGATFTLHVKLEGNPLGNARPYDLHVDLPANAYYKLGVERQKRWVFALKKESIHVIGEV